MPPPSPPSPPAGDQPMALAIKKKRSVPSTLATMFARAAGTGAPVTTTAAANAPTRGGLSGPLRKSRRADRPG